MSLRLYLLLWVFLLSAYSANAGALATNEDAQKWEQLMTDTARSLRISNNVPGAIQLCEEAMKVADQFGPKDIRLSRSQMLRAEVYLWEKKNDLAEQAFKLAILSCEKAVGSNDVALVDPLSSLANFYLSGVPRYEEVVPLYGRILEIARNAPVKNERDIIMWSRDLGMIYQQMGRYVDGEPLFMQAVSIAERSDAAWLPNELLAAADFYRGWGRYDQAEAQARRALEIRERKMKSSDGVDARMDVTVCLNNLGATYLLWSKPEKAEAVYGRSVELVKSFMADDPADLMPPLEGLAAALRAEGKLEQAEPVFQRVLVLKEKNAEPESLNTAEWLEKYAGLLNDLKKSEEAKIFLERAKVIRAKNNSKPGEAASVSF